jgi:transcriptional regulator
MGSDEALVRELRRIADLLALLVTRRHAQGDQIRTMRAVGYTPSEIASLLHTTRNTVSVTLSQQKAAKSKATAKKRAKAKPRKR